MKTTDETTKTAAAKVPLKVTMGSGETRTLEVRKGSSLERIAVRQGLPLEFDCRKADCGICLIRVVDGNQHVSEMTLAERDFLKAMRANDNERLACQCRILETCHILLDDDPMPLQDLIGGPSRTVDNSDPTQL